MNRKVIKMAAVLIGYACSVWALRGAVMESESGSPLSGAIVRLVKAEVEATVGADGTFNLEVDAAVNTPQYRHTYSGAQVRNGRVYFGLTARSPVRMSIFTLNGKCIDSYGRTFPQGNHSLSVFRSGRRYPEGFYVVRYRSANSSATFKVLHMHNSGSGNTVLTEFASTHTVENSAEYDAGVNTAAGNAIDTLVIVKKEGDEEHGVRKVLIYDYFNDLGDLSFILFDPIGDMDDDGLTNYEERYLFFTDPRKADSDGDGWNDYEETGKYSPNTPLRFNNLIADVPEIEMIVSTYPQISYTYTLSNSEEQTVEISTGNEHSFEKSSTFGNEVSGFVQLRIMYGFDVKIGTENTWTQHFEVEPTIGVGYAHTWGKSIVNSWTNSYNEAKSNTVGQSIEREGGEIKIGIAFRNNSSIAYTLSDPVITAYIKAYQSESVNELIGELAPEQSGAISLEPGQTSEIRVFRKDDFPNPDVIGRLVGKANGMISKLSAYSVEMDGRTFDEQNTDIFNQTANVIIDYGPGRKVVDINVASLTRYNEFYTSSSDIYRPVTVAELLGSMHMDYTMDTVDGKWFIGSIDGISNNSASNRKWFFSLFSADDSLTTYCHSYNLDEIPVYTTERIVFYYVVDNDDDGLSVRVENGMGTSDSLKDTDGDGLDDDEELYGWRHDPSDKTLPLFKTNPLETDSDFDSVPDPDDPDPLMNPEWIESSSVEVEKITLEGTSRGFAEIKPVDGEVSFDVDSVFSCSFLKVRLDAKDRMSSVWVEYVDKDLEDIRLTLLGGYEHIFGSDSIRMDIGENAFKIRVTSEDESETEVYTLGNVRYDLPDGAGRLISNEETAVTERLNADLILTVTGLDSVKVENPSITGLLLFRSTSSKSPADYLGTRNYVEWTEYTLGDYGYTPIKFTTSDIKTDSGLVTLADIYYHSCYYSELDGGEVHYGPVEQDFVKGGNLGLIDGTLKLLRTQVVITMHETSDEGNADEIVGTSTLETFSATTDFWKIDNGDTWYRNLFDPEMTSCIVSDGTVNLNVHLMERDTKDTDVFNYTAQIPAADIVHGSVSNVGNAIGENSRAMKLEKTDGTYQTGTTVLKHDDILNFQGDGRLEFFVVFDWELVN